MARKGKSIFESCEYEMIDKGGLNCSSYVRIYLVTLIFMVLIITNLVIIIASFISSVDFFKYVGKDGKDATSFGIPSTVIGGSTLIFYIVFYAVVISNGKGISDGYGKNWYFLQSKEKGFFYDVKDPNNAKFAVEPVLNKNTVAKMTRKTNLGKIPVDEMNFLNQISLYNLKKGGNVMKPVEIKDMLVGKGLAVSDKEMGLIKIIQGRMRDTGKTAKSIVTKMDNELIKKISTRGPKMKLPEGVEKQKKTVVKEKDRGLIEFLYDYNMKAPCFYRKIEQNCTMSDAKAYYKQLGIPWPDDLGKKCEWVKGSKKTLKTAGGDVQVDGKCKQVIDWNVLNPFSSTFWRFDPKGAEIDVFGRSIEYNVYWDADLGKYIPKETYFTLRCDRCDDLSSNCSSAPIAVIGGFFSFWFSLATIILVGILLDNMDTEKTSEGYQILLYVMIALSSCCTLLSVWLFMIGVLCPAGSDFGYAGRTG